MSKIGASAIGIIGWIIYGFDALDRGKLGSVLGAAICIFLIFYLIWFKLEEVD